MARGKSTKGYRMTENRKKLLQAGYSIDQIISGNLNANNVINEIEADIFEFEDDNVILDNQANFFLTLEKTALGVALGISKSLIVSGPAGIGKSHGIEHALGKIKDSEYNHCHIKGHVKATGLFSKLYDYRHENCVVIFDDCDALFNDDVSLGILKHALDMKETRKISWLSKTEIISEDSNEVIPSSFEFKGSCIFLTNLNISQLIFNGGKLAPHLEAIISRSLYIDGYTIFKSKRDYLIRIEHLASEIFDNENIGDIGRELILNFIRNNSEKMRELSLRVIGKLCAIYKIDSDNFEAMASALTAK